MNQLEVELTNYKAENGLRRHNRGVSRAQIPSSGRIERRNFDRTPEDIFPIREKTKMKDRVMFYQKRNRNILHGTTGLHHQLRNIALQMLMRY
jgi:hypothetical protein